MRQKADKLEKGKWYCDSLISTVTTPTFFKFDRTEFGFEIFESMIDYGGYYNSVRDVFPIKFNIGGNWFIPTPEDIKKYNLNETE